jgi:hypothetical protein
MKWQQKHEEDILQGLELIRSKIEAGFSTYN